MHVGGTVALAGEAVAKAEECFLRFADKAGEGLDFFPMTVEYREKYYAGGRFPGGFLKRENRPSDKEILVSRVIDRPIRPLFPENYFNEVQIFITLLSAQKETR